MSTSAQPTLLLSQGALYQRRRRKKNPEPDRKYRASYRGKFAQLKRASKRGNLVLNISFEQYVQLMEENPVCHYCRGSLSRCGYNLDRLDFEKGYTLENVVPCCGIKEGSRDKGCNARKGRLEQIGFKYPRTVELMFELSKR